MYSSKVSWGRIQVIQEDEASGPSFDFLTSNFGGLLPPGRVPLAVPVSGTGDACLPLTPLSRESAAAGSAFLITRGNCPFDVKVMNVQTAGGSIAVIEDPLDRPLQRIGASHPLDGYAGIPSIAVPLQCSDYIRKLATENKKISFLLEGLYTWHSNFNFMLPTTILLFAHTFY